MGKRENLKRRLNFHRKLLEGEKKLGLTIARQETAALAEFAEALTSGELARMQPNDRALLCIMNLETGEQ